MDRLKKERAPLRAAFTRAANALKLEIDKGPEGYDVEQIEVLAGQFYDKFERLQPVEDQVLDTLLDDVNVTTDQYSEEQVASENYRDKFTELRIKVDSIREHVRRHEVASVSEGGRRKFKLPQIDLKKFSGLPEDWIRFWSQFEKIHEDTDIAQCDKLVYLQSYMVTGSKAEKLMSRYPASSANYPKAVEALKHRFGREKLQVQVYVRKLLKLVIQNAIDRGTKRDLSTLYDEIETYLQALESLGRTRKKFSDFLGPLVESCLPTEVLSAWQRKIGDEEEDCEELLTKLMEFVRKEVNSEEMVKLAQTSFVGPEGVNDGVREKYGPRKDKPGSHPGRRESPTAATLVTTNATDRRPSGGSFVCTFCDKTHASQDCRYAMSLEVEERKKIILEKRACLACLKIGHLSRACRNPGRCIVCSGKHYTIICTEQSGSSNRSQKSPRNEATNTSSKEQKTSAPSSSVVLANCAREEAVLLQTLFVYLESPTENITAKVLFDTGSQGSYISKELAKRAGLEPVAEKSIIHVLFGNQRSVKVNHQVHRIYLSSLDGGFRCNLEAMEQVEICNNVSIVDSDTLQKLQELDMGMMSSLQPKLETSTIDILLGADVVGKLLEGEVKQLGGGLTAVKSLLGWTLMGKLPAITTGDHQRSLSLLVKNMNVEDLWKFETIGIEDPGERKSRKEKEVEVLKHFRDTVTTNSQGRYCVELPWKEDHGELRDLKRAAWRRHEVNQERLAKDDLLEEYRKVFTEWEKLEIIEPVPTDHLNSTCCYLPHRAVVKMTSKTTKVRPVFDASARERNSASLIQCLYSGPNLIERIPDILSRFRWSRIGATADIEKAFLQIEVAERDRDFLRFYEPREGRIYRHRRVVFGVNSSPFLLGAVLLSHFDKSVEPGEQDTIARLKEAFYVDNCMVSVENEDELLRFKNQATEILSRACFHLRDWRHNQISGEPFEEKEISVLGLIWDLETDRLRWSFPVVDSHEGKETKRSILSVMQSIFDPLGVLCPMTMIPKKLLREMCHLGLDWDDPAPEKIVREFKAWKEQLILAERIEIPRWTQGTAGEAELHLFVDASQEAYAACVFLRVLTAEQPYPVHLLQAKSRIAPKGKCTIPRLELMACVIGARLLRNVLDGLKRDLPIFCWSDSTTALWWLQHEGPWSTFVQNRVEEVRRLTQVGRWRHISGNLNPADLPSRGATGLTLWKSRWWEGPRWLTESHESTYQSEILQSSEEVDLERKRSKTVLVDLKENNSSQSHWLFSGSKDWTRLVRLVPLIRRAIRNLKGEKIRGELSQDEVKQGEIFLIREIQTKSKEDLKSLNPEKIRVDENGILRFQTPIIAREDSRDFLYPICLSGKHPLTRSLILHIHKEKCHAGTQMLMRIIRENYWVTSLRRLVKSVVRECVQCRRHDAKPIAVEQAPLPLDRVKDTAIFQVTGIDMAGPVILKGGEKAWIAIFTCAVYRAVHFELVSSMSTEAFILALRRFISRRGRVTTIYSDNGLNFVGANNFMASLDWEAIVKRAGILRITWKFNPPTAAWWGGWWERLIGVMKRLLKRTLGRASLSYEEMTTILCDCEAVINSRPLTYLEEDPESLMPLTPGLFLHELSTTNVADIDMIDGTYLRRRALYRKQLIEGLRSRFRIEYLGLLKSSRRQTKQSPPLKIGEIVLIGDDAKRRIDWLLGRVLQLYPGRDGKVRCVRVKTQRGEINRPIQRIFPLEIRTCTKEKDEGIASDQPANSQLEDHESKEKSQRTASDQPANSQLEVLERTETVVGNASDQPASSQTEIPRSAKSIELCPDKNREMKPDNFSLSTSGRVIKPVKRLDLLNIPLVLFEPGRLAQRWEYVRNVN